MFYFLVCFYRHTFLGYALIFVDAITMKRYLHILSCVLAVDNPAAQIASKFLQSVSSASASSAAAPSSAKDSITAVASANEQSPIPTSQ